MRVLASSHSAVPLAAQTQASVPPLLAALRAGTRLAHERMEAQPTMANLLSPDLNTDDYSSALRAMWRFHTTMQQRLAPLAAQAGWPVADADVLAFLARDLAWLEVALPKVRQARPQLASRPAALGALYVVEGSALGGRVIGRAVAASLGVGAGHGGSFYCGTQAEGARARWRAFCEVLAREGAGLDKTGFARAVAGANAAFRYLERLLQDTPASLPRRQGRSRLPYEAPTAVPDRAGAAARTTI